MGRSFDKAEFILGLSKTSVLQQSLLFFLFFHFNFLKIDPYFNSLSILRFSCPSSFLVPFCYFLTADGDRILSLLVHLGSMNDNLRQALGIGILLGSINSKRHQISHIEESKIFVAGWIIHLEREKRSEEYHKKKEEAERGRKQRTKNAERKKK